MWLRIKMQIMRLLICCFILIGWQSQTPYLLAAESYAAEPTTSKPPSRATIQSNRAKPQLIKLSAKNCVDFGSRFQVEGKDLGTARNQSLFISDSVKPIQLRTSNWSSQQIVSSIPQNAQLDKGKTYRLAIPDNSDNKWLTQSEPILLICNSSVANMSSSSALPDSTRTPAREPANSAASESRAESRARVEPGKNNDPDNETERELTAESVNDRSGSLMGRSLPSPPQISIAPAPAQKPDFETNQLVVLSANMQEATDLANKLKSFNLRVKNRKKLASLGLVISVFRTPKDQDLIKLSEAIRNENPQVWLDLNHHYQLLSDSRHTIGHSMIRWPTACQKVVKVGQLDTMVDLEHQALDKNKVTTKVFRPKRSNAVKDGHGSAIASLLVGNKTANFPGGMLTKGHLYAADIFWEKSDKKYTSTEWILKGLDWLASQDVSVINMSFGGRHNLLLELAIGRLAKQQIYIVAAAGNSGKNAPAVYPAAFDKALAVTAIDSKQRLYKKANRGEYIDFAAPGVSIWTAHKKNGFKYQQGTSFAAPFVTAMIAISDFDTLKKASLDLGEPGKDSSYGWGLAKMTNGCE